MGKNTYAQIGTVEQSRQLTVSGLNGQSCVRADIRRLKDIWKKPLSF
jgi:hypothetical protein